MSGAGSLFDMIGKLRVNQALRREKRTTYTRVRQMYIDSFAWKNFHEQQHEVLNPEELKRLKQEIRNNIKKEIRKERIKKTLAFSIAVFTLASLLVFLFNQY